MQKHFRKITFQTYSIQLCKYNNNNIVLSRTSANLIISKEKKTIYTRAVIISRSP